MIDNENTEYKFENLEMNTMKKKIRVLRYYYLDNTKDLGYF